MAYSLVPPFRTRRPISLKRLWDNGINGVASGEVALDLFFAPGGFELRHQISRADYIFSQSANHLERTAIDQRNREHQIIGRVLHGDVAMVRQHRLYLLEQFLPGGILMLAAGKGIQMSGFNFVNQFDGIALGGNQIVPAPGDHGAFGQAQAPGRQLDRDDGDRRRARHQCCARAERPVWREGSWANNHSNQRRRFRRIGLPLSEEELLTARNAKKSAKEAGDSRP